MRLLAVTGDASLLVALTSMLRDWEVQIVRDPTSAANAAPGAVVVLVDFGTTERGLATAEQIWELGVKLPCLVVGDTQAPDARARVLVRPFTLNDLIEAIDRLAPVPVVKAPIAVADGSPVETIAEIEPAAAPSVSTETLKVSADGAPSDTAPHDVEAEKAEPVELPPEVAAPGHEGVAPRARGLFRRKPAPGKSAPRDPIAEQLRRVLEGLADLDVLIDKMPPLARPRAMAHAFLREVVERFAPEIAAVYVLANDGMYHAAASHGLSQVEAGMKVPPEQLLFMEITGSLEAVLIAPVDLAQGLVSGIGGARTEAIIAAPVTVDGACHGVIVVGRKDFSTDDLDALAELANEAGPGLAVAQTIERFRSR